MARAKLPIKVREGKGGKGRKWQAGIERGAEEKSENGGETTKNRRRAGAWAPLTGGWCGAGEGWGRRA